MSKNLIERKFLALAANFVACKMRGKPREISVIYSVYVKLEEESYVGCLKRYIRTGIRRKNHRNRNGSIDFQ